MNILQIVPQLKSGGVERGTVDFAKYLHAQGHRSVIVSSGGPLVNGLLDSGVVHYSLPVHKKNLISIWRCVREVASIIRKEHIDLVHARSRVPAWIAMMSCRRERIPFVTTCHGVYNTHWMSRVMAWGKIVIVISHAVSLHMKERFGLPHRRLRLIHRGVNLEEFVMKEKALEDRNLQTVGIIGRITPIKGHAVLIKAMARVVRAFPKARLVVVGDSPKHRYIDELRMLARRLGIEKRVDFVGTRYDIPDLLKRFDLLVAPAIGEEAFGRVIIEAGASGIPVIASRIGGIVDILEHEVDGLLVPAGDVAALAEAITKLLRDPELSGRFAAALRQKVERLFNDRHMFERTLQVYQEAVDRKRILVLKFSALGDVVLSIPSIRALRQKYPKAFITAVVERSSRPVLRNCPYLDDLVSFDGDGGGSRWTNLWKLGKFLAKEYFDVVVDLQNNRWSHLLSYLSGAHSRIGYNNGKFAFFLNSKVRDSVSLLSPIDHQFQTLKLMGFRDVDRRLELWTREHDEERVRRFLKDQWLGENQMLVGINAAASRAWPTKQWPAERYSDICDKLSKHNIRVVITGDRAAAKTAETVVRRSKAKPINAAGKTNVSELIALIRRCDAFVTSDSAPMHISAAVGTPFVAIFGPTEPRRHIAAETGFTLIRADIKCSPCYLRRCPIGLICMKKIGSEEVLEGVLKLLQAKEAVAEISK